MCAAVHAPIFFHSPLSNPQHHLHLLPQVLSGLLQVWHSVGSLVFCMHVVFILQGGIGILPALTPGIRWLDRRHRASVFLRQIISGNTTLPSFIWSSLTITCVLTGVSTHSMGDGSHVLQQALSFESGTHEPANSFPSCNIRGGSNGLLIEHFPGDRPVALWHRSGNTIGFDIYTCHLYAYILGRVIHMAFIRNGTKLVYCAPDFGLRI